MNQIQKIPFNLLAALEGKPVITGVGKIEAYYPNDIFPVVARIKEYGSKNRYTKEGKVFERCDTPEKDLYMKPEKIVRWLMVNKGTGFATKEEILGYSSSTNNKSALAKENAIIKIEFSLGEGIEEKEL